MVGFGDPNEAYHEGKMAYVADVTLAACPYAPTSRDYQQMAGRLARNEPQRSAAR